MCLSHMHASIDLPIYLPTDYNADTFGPWDGSSKLSLHRMMTKSYNYSMYVSTTPSLYYTYIHTYLTFSLPFSLSPPSFSSGDNRPWSCLLRERALCMKVFIRMIRRIILDHGLPGSMVSKKGEWRGSMGRNEWGADCVRAKEGDLSQHMCTCLHTGLFGELILQLIEERPWLVLKDVSPPSSS